MKPSPISFPNKIGPSRQLPFNTGKVLIGAEYSQPSAPASTTFTEDRVQEALLNWQRMSDADSRLIYTTISRSVFGRGRIERRRSGVRARVARMTWPARQVVRSVGRFLMQRSPW